MEKEELISKLTGMRRRMVENLVIMLETYILLLIIKIKNQIIINKTRQMVAWILWETTFMLKAAWENKKAMSSEEVIILLKMTKQDSCMGKILSLTTQLMDQYLVIRTLQEKAYKEL
jgi:hypothetical protein